jgi:hypothetical protein
MVLVADEILQPVMAYTQIQPQLRFYFHRIRKAQEYVRKAVWC